MKRFFKIVFGLLILLSASPVFAGVYLTKAEGAEALSGADVSGSWTSLSPIIVREGMPADIKLQDLILKVPEGFELNTESQPSVLATGGVELLVHFGSMSSDQIVINVTQLSATVPHTLTIGESTPIQVRPTKNEAIEGKIYMFSSSMEGVLNGTDGTSFGDLVIVPVEEQEEEEEQEEADAGDQEAESTEREELMEQIAEIQLQIKELMAQIIKILEAKISEIISQISEQ